MGMLQRTWTVHGLQAEFLLLDLEHKHVLLVVSCVSALFPKVKVVDVGRAHFLIFVLPIQLLYVLQTEGQGISCLHTLSV